MYRTRTFFILLLMMQALFAQTRGPLPVIPDVDDSLTLSQGYIEVSFGSLYYEMLGEGENVILIHSHPFNSHMWDAQFQELARDYRIIRYDLRGYGASTSQVEYIQFTHADDLACLMHALAIDKAHIIGFETGGNITADMLASYPERVSSAVMINGHISKGKGPSEPMDAEESARRDEEIVSLSGTDPEELKQKFLEELKQKTGNITDTVFSKLQEMAGTWDTWQYFHKEARVTGGMDTYNILSENPTEIPVLVIETDSGNTGTTDVFSKLFSGGEYKLIDNSGYFLHMEQPQVFNTIISDFLQRK